MCMCVHMLMCIHGHTDAHACTNQRITLSVILQKEHSFAFLEKRSISYLDLPR